MLSWGSKWSVLGILAFRSALWKAELTLKVRLYCGLSHFPVPSQLCPLLWQGDIWQCLGTFLCCHTPGGEKLLTSGRWGMPLSVPQCLGPLCPQGKPSTNVRRAKTEKLWSMQNRVRTVMFSYPNGHFFVNQQFGGILEKLTIPVFGHHVFSNCFLKADLGNHWTYMF